MMVLSLMRLSNIFILKQTDISLLSYDITVYRNNVKLITCSIKNRFMSNMHQAAPASSSKLTYDVCVAGGTSGG